MKVERSLDCLEVKHDREDYVLGLRTEFLGGENPPIRGDFTDVSFVRPINGDILHITGRNLDEYEAHEKQTIVTFLDDSRKQYLEVGAGLGELVPYLVRTFGKSLQKRPIIIDPVNYRVLGEMLRYSQDLELPERTRQKVNELLARIEIIENPLKVRLINTTLLNAVSKFPDLIGCADCVVDCAAARGYPAVEFQDYYERGNFEKPKEQRNRIEAGLQSLLGPEGILLG